MGKNMKGGKKSRGGDEIMDFVEHDVDDVGSEDDDLYGDDEFDVDNDSEMSIDVDEPIEEKPKKKKSKSKAESDKNDEKKKKKKENKEDSKSKKSEKNLNKPVNVNQTMQDFKEAVKKVRKAMKQTDDEANDQKQKKIARKRKLPQEEKNDAGKKQKIEELTFKERKEVRKKQNKNYESSKTALKLWEKLRVFDQSPEERKKVCDDLYRQVSGKATHFTNAHDTARVVQTLIKYGSAEQKNALFNELKDQLLVMTKSLYAKFIVRKFLKYGTKGHRDCIFSSLKGHIRKLVRHKEAADIIECAYNMFANASQRAAMVEEFYGPLFVIYKTEEQKTLAQVLAAHPDKCEPILTSMKETLTALVEKNSLQYSFVHKLFLDYFTFANEKLRVEMIETIRESTIHMLHTREGARVAMMCLWHGTAKDRKATVKSFKTLVQKICLEEYGHMVMLALFDVVDDTKLVSKAILDELLKSLDAIAADQYGRKVLLYLLQARDPLHFHPDIVSVLQQGDGNAHRFLMPDALPFTSSSLTSSYRTDCHAIMSILTECKAAKNIHKKDAQVRRDELLSHVSRPLIQWIGHHAEQFSLNNSMLPFILSVVQHAKCDPTEAMRAISRVAGKSYTPQTDHIVEHPAGHLTLKRLILNDNQRIKNSELVLFSNILLDIVTEDALVSWTACNRGCFIIVGLLEVENKEVVKRVKEKMSSSKSVLKTRTFKGAQILLEKLK